MLSIGDYHVGTFCGERFWSLRSWKANALLRRVGAGFAIGPVLFWKEQIR